MTDSTESGHIVNERATGSTEFVVKADTSREAQTALQDTFFDAGKGAGAVTLEGQDVFAGR